MRTRRVGFAVVGLGSIARSSVLPAFARSKKARLVALVGRDQTSAGRLARAFGVQKFYGSGELGECLGNPEVEAVYVATPQGQHEWIAVQAARSGKHVLCEKPLAATVQQAKRMLEACRKNDVVLMTAYRKYYEASTRFLKKLIQGGKLGRVDVIHTAFSELHVPGQSIEWLLRSKMAGGGPLMDLGIYCVNTCRWLVEADPVEVSGQAWKHDKRRFREVEEGITFRMQFPGGLVVQGSSSYGAAMSSLIYLQGTSGWVSLAPAFDFNEERNLTGRIDGRPIQRRFAVVDEFAPELDAFAAAIRGDRKIEPDGVQGYRDMVILQCIYESARKGKPVKVRYPG